MAAIGMNEAALVLQRMAMERGEQFHSPYTTIFPRLKYGSPTTIIFPSFDKIKTMQSLVFFYNLVRDPHITAPNTERAIFASMMCGNIAVSMLCFECSKLYQLLLKRPPFLVGSFATVEERCASL